MCDLFPLHSAIYSSNYRSVKTLLDEGVNVNLRDEENRTPLLIALYIKLSLDFGADVNARVRYETDILQLAINWNIEKDLKNLLGKKAVLNRAVIEKNLIIIKSLLEHGANVEAIGYRNNLTALKLAVRMGNEEVVEALIEGMADVNAVDECGQTPLHMAVKGISFRIVKFLIEHGANVNAKDELGSSVLHVAAWKGNEESIKALLDKGVDINEVDRHGITPLHTAARGKNLRIVRFLIEHGANVNAKDKLGKSMLHWAADTGIKESIKALLDKGVDINEVDRHGITPLHVALERRNLTTAEFLIENGANVNARNQLGSSVLHLAARIGNEKSIEALLDKGVDINAVDKNGETPLHIALDRRDLIIVKFLLEHKANVDAETTSHQTPLHIASRFGNLSACSLLLEHGADVNFADLEGEIPLCSAFRLGHRKVVKYLLGKGSDVNITTDWLRIRYRDGRGYGGALRELYVYMRIHMIKLKAAGLHVNDIKHIMKKSSHLLGTEQYELRCKEEFEKLKSKISGNNVSPSHILTTKNPRYVLNKTLVEVLESINYHEFPIYGILIKSKLKSDQRRFSLLKTCKRLEIMDKDKGITLSSDIWEKIISELQNRDLRILPSCSKSKQSK